MTTAPPTANTLAETMRRNHRATLFQRRDVDEKCEQLRSVSNAAALIAGFSVVVLINVNQSDARYRIEEWFYTLFAFTAALTVCLMTYTFLTCTLMLVAVLKKFEAKNDCDSLTGGDGFYSHAVSPAVMTVQQQPSFENRFEFFWKSTCEKDWNRAVLTFSWGVPAFLCNIIIGAWVKFLPRLWPGSIVTFVCLSTITYLFWTTHVKWGRFLISS